MANDVRASVFVVLLATAVAGGAVFACEEPTSSVSASAPPDDASDAGRAVRPPPTGPEDDPPPDDFADAGTCPGAPGTFYDFTLKTLTYREDFPTCRLAGKVLLVVNVASLCGYTVQYGPLEALYQKYKAQGFVVLGFPSRSFDQEFEDEKEISAFCTDEYKITFPMFALGNVNPPDEQPLYTWLKAQPGYADPVAWNFEKWLVSRKGEIVKRIAYTTSPDEDEVVSAIEAELAE